MSDLLIGNSDSGRYLHAADENHGLGTRVLRLTVDGEEQVWVHADDFMDAQKQRDDLRREWALLNAMVHGAKSHVEVREAAANALGRLGFTAADAAAMIDVIRWAQTPEADRA